MANGMNKCIGVGYVGSDPELRFTPAGKAVCNFSLGITEGKKDEKVTDWWAIVAWEDLAVTCDKYIKKGDLVLVEGRLKSNRYTSKLDGVERTKANIVIYKMQILHSKNQQNVKEVREDEYGLPY